MFKIKRETVKTILFHVLFLLVVFAFQAVVFPYLPVWGYVPVLLPLAVVGTGLFEGSVRGGTFGIFAGMLCDTAFSQPVAVFTIVLTVVGLAAGALGETVMARGFPSFFVCCIGALLLTSFVQMFSLLFFTGVASKELLVTALYQIGYSLIFSLPVYWAARSLGRRAKTD